MIEQLYRSLQRQTFSNFEWVVVDDGSSDNTQELFMGWQQEQNPFPIQYVRQPNGGKCSAINRGLDLARGRLFFTVDSDDYLTDDALEKVIGWDAEIPSSGKYCGLAGNLGTSEYTTPNRIFEGRYFDGTALDRYGIVDGERAMVFYTAVHRRYRYPIFSGEKFMTEAVAWNRMANDGYRMRFYNDIIWVYDYKEDGLTKAGSSLFLNNPKGYGLMLREKAAFLHWPFERVLRMWYTFTCDLSLQYTSLEISRYIEAPYPFIALINILHKLIHFIRK